MRELELPPDIAGQDQRQEVFRAWIDGGMMSTTVCNLFPESYTATKAEIWGIFLSDTLHHVADAISLQTERKKKDILHVLTENLRQVILSERGTRSNILKIIDRQTTGLPAPDVSEDQSTVEMVRIFLVPGFIRVIVCVGMWLPDDEEATWGHLLYDMAAMIASSINDAETDALKFQILKHALYFIDNPGTEFEGQFYDKN